MRLLATAIAAAGLCVSTAAGAALITFENDGLAPLAMTNAPGSPVPLASRLADQYLSLGALFSSEAGYAAVVNHFPADPTATPTPPAIVGGTTAGGLLDYAAAITITFVKPGDAGIGASTGRVRILGDRFPLNSGSVTMSAFDLGGALLGSVTVPDVGPIGTGPVLELTLAGIHSVVVSGDSGTVGFDNLEFDALSFPVPAPAPATSLLLLAGLAGAALARVRRA